MKHRAELAVLLTSIDELLTKWGAGDFDQRILSWISHFVHGVDAAIFYCYQQNNQTLVVAESCGFEREIKELFSLQIGEGLCGQVFATGQGRLINDLRQIEDLAEEMNSSSKAIMRLVCLLLVYWPGILIGWTSRNG
ncbi:MAG: hypothetical protein RRY35_02490 [Clostridiales bacterium]